MREFREGKIAAIVDSIPESYLAGYYPGLHGRGSTLIDRSKNANNGTITGATWVRLPSGLYVLSFDGSGDVVNLGNDSSLRLSSAFTLMSWVNITTPASNLVILSRRTTSNNWQLYTNATPKFGFTYWVSGVEKTLVNQSTATLVTSTWYLLAVTHDASNDILYLNGVLDKSQTAAGNADTNSTVTTFGALNTSAFQSFNGKLALPRLCSRALTATELLRAFNREHRLFGA